MYKIYDCLVIILKKEREFFAKIAKFTIKTTTEWLKFYSLNTENKESHFYNEPYLRMNTYVKSKDVNQQNYSNLFFSWRKITIF